MPGEEDCPVRDPNGAGMESQHSPLVQHCRQTGAEQIDADVSQLAAASALNHDLVAVANSEPGHAGDVQEQLVFGRPEVGPAISPGREIAHNLAAADDDIGRPGGGHHLGQAKLGVKYQTVSGIDVAAHAYPNGSITSQGS